MPPTTGSRAGNGYRVGWGLSDAHAARDGGERRGAKIIVQIDAGPAATVLQERILRRIGVRRRHRAVEQRTTQADANMRVRQRNEVRMAELSIRATYVGGPTALIEVNGVRFLTDPTFDPSGTSYETPVYTLRKTQGPAVSAEALGPLDAVLLSHDHHFDNLDRAGRAMLAQVPRVLAPRAGAERLGGNATGLAPWQTVDVVGGNGQHVPVIGHTGSARTRRRRSWSGRRILLASTVYVSGDTSGTRASKKWLDAPRFVWHFCSWVPRGSRKWVPRISR